MRLCIYRSTQKTCSKGAFEPVANATFMSQKSAVSQLPKIPCTPVNQRFSPKKKEKRYCSLFHEKCFLSVAEMQSRRSFPEIFFFFFRWHTKPLFRRRRKLKINSIKIAANIHATLAFPPSRAQIHRTAYIFRALLKLSARSEPGLLITPLIIAIAASIQFHLFRSSRVPSQTLSRFSV